MTLFVRLRPFNKPKGYVMRTHTAPWGGRGGTKYIAGVWHKIKGDEDADASMREYLDSVHQNVVDPRSPRAFDVCGSEHEAKLLVEQDRMERLARMANTSMAPPRSVVPSGVVSEIDYNLNQPEPTEEIQIAGRRPPPPVVDKDDSAPMINRSASTSSKKSTKRKSSKKKSTTRAKG